MANKHMNTRSASLVIKEVQIKEHNEVSHHIH